MNDKPETDNLLRVENLKIHFSGDGPVARAVDGVDIRIGRQETVCIVGESGCGKTVTALAVMGLLKQPPAAIAEGRITFDGHDLLDLAPNKMRELRGRRIAMVFQEPMTSLNPVFSIGDQIGEAILAHFPILQQEVRRRTIRLLEDVGIVEPERRLGDFPHQLSGGQRQRVMIAMALACEPDLIIADEPTTALDVTVQARILNLLKRIKAEKKMAIGYITHDLGVVAAIADRVYVMYSGMVVEEGITRTLFDAPRHPYTIALLDSLPTREKRGQRLYSIPGSVPHPAYRPRGCPFGPRCKYRRAFCQKGVPKLCDYNNGHLARCPILYAEREQTGKGVP